MNLNKLFLLKNLHLNKSVLLVSAGPSAKNWKEVYSKLNDPELVVVCIKQSVDLDNLNELCDIHFINCYNLKKYKYKRKPLIIYSSAKDAPPSFSHWDFEVIVNKTPDQKLCDTLASKLNFNDYSIEKKGINRPWGPGILFETVFYILAYMGVKKITTIGWDIADSKGHNKHFDDDKPIKENLDSILRKICHKLGVGIIYNYINYNLGNKYNHASMLPGEAEIISKAIPHLKNWLSSKNIELEIISDSKWIKI